MQVASTQIDIPAGVAPASHFSPILLKLLEDAQRSLRTDLEASREALGRAAEIISLGLSNREPQDAPRTGGLAPWQSKRIETYIRNNIDGSISIETLANLVDLSTSYLCRAFKVSFGESPHAYVMRQRVTAARRMMLETREPLSQVASACGFSDQAHLCRLFRRMEGTSPNKWRRDNWLEQPRYA